MRQPPPRPPAGSSVPRGKTKALRTLAASQKSVSERSSKSAFNFPATPARQRSQPERAETHSDSAARMRRRARPRDSAGRHDAIGRRSAYARAGISNRQFDRKTSGLRIPDSARVILRPPPLSEPAMTEPIDRIIRLPAVLKATGLSRSTLYRKIN